jgi:hypothetical protein
MPSVDTIFRKLIEEEIPELQNHLENECKRNDEHLENPKPKTVMSSFPAPPDIRYLKPLQIPPKNIEIESHEQQKKAISPIVRFEKIPIDQKLSKADVVDAISSNIVIATEEWKKWLTGLLEYEQQQWKLRIQILQNAREARDLDKQTSEIISKTTSNKDEKQKRKKK